MSISEHRMPKRKKSTSNRKASLLFTENPFSIRHHTVSPVLSAHYPQTARSVPLDEYFDISWVSPQFREQRDVSRRVTRSRSQRPALKELDGQISHQHRSKFKSLKFVNNPTIEETEIENIEITENDQSPQNKWTSQKTRSKLQGIESGISVFHQDPASIHKHDEEKNQYAALCKCLLNNSSSVQHQENCVLKETLFSAHFDNASTSEAYSHLVQEPVISSPSTPDHIHVEVHNKVDLGSHRLSRKWNKKYVDTLKLLQSETPVKNKSNPKQPYVLVMDTPESEYGISVRQRNKIRRKTSCLKING